MQSNFDNIQDFKEGQVITFYSYKGGTGRTMALVNIAYLLSLEPGKKVLMIDWDLEAPGLHRYASTLFKENNLDSKPGLIEFFLRLEKNYEKLKQFDGYNNEFDLFLESVINGLILKTDINLSSQLYLIKAGAFDSDYADKINNFHWQKLFQEAPLFFSSFSEYLSRHYDYILIDSRTGLTDTSGICTMLMPEKLVLVFTPNNQSLNGVIEIGRRAINYRNNNFDSRALKIFPLPSRIEMAEKELRETWRLGDGKGIKGFQKEFELLIKELYKLDECSMTNYFNEIQIRHESRYAYGEQLAVLDERSADIYSLTNSYSKFKDKLTSDAHIWDSFTIMITGNSFEAKLFDFLENKLEELGIIVLRDKFLEELKPGEDNLSSLTNNFESFKKELKNVDAVLVFLRESAVTKEAASIQNVFFDLRIKELVNQNAHIIPVLLDDISFEKMPVELRHYLAISGYKLGNEELAQKVFDSILPNQQKPKTKNIRFTIGKK